MKIDRSEFEKMSSEEAVMRSVLIRPTADVNWPYEAVCSICDIEYAGFGHCDSNRCWHSKKSFAYCNIHSGEVADESIERLCGMLKLTFVGHIAFQSMIHDIYDTHEEAVNAYSDWERADNQPPASFMAGNW
jgi:hypothetical protein